MLYWIISLTRDVGVESVRWPPSYFFLPYLRTRHKYLWRYLNNVNWTDKTSFWEWTSRKSRKVRNRETTESSNHEMWVLSGWRCGETTKEVQIHNDSILLCTLREEYVVIITAYSPHDMDVSSTDIIGLMSHSPHAEWRVILLTERCHCSNRGCRVWKTDYKVEKSCWWKGL